MSVQTYQKHQGTALSPYFTSSEFDCPCSHCSTTLIDSALADKLYLLRQAIKAPIKIGSGYRCSWYQADLRARGFETAAGVSQHELGKAVDFSSAGKTGQELETFARSVGFRAVGVASTWVHVDLREDKDRRWTYKN